MATLLLVDTGSAHFPVSILDERAALDDLKRRDAY